MFFSWRTVYIPQAYAKGFTPLLPKMPFS